MTIFLAANEVSAQRYITRNGVARLHYNHPVWGSLETVNRQVNVGMNIETGEIRMNILMLSFRFRRAFNQEFYNNYFIERPHYANASFVGHVANIDEIDFDRPGTYTIEVVGDLTLRDFTNPVSATADFVVTNEGFEGEALFDINIKDFMNMSHPSSQYWPDMIQIGMEVKLRRL